MADRSVSVELRAHVNQFQQAMASARQDVTKVVGELNALGRASRKAADDMQPLGVAMAGVGAGIGIASALAVKAAVDFESAFAGVAKTVEGTDAELAAMSDGIRAMARELPASTGEIASVAEAAGALGVETGSVLDFTRVMIDLGETTNLTADQAATAFARIANVMGTAQSEFDRMGSTVVALGNNGASTEAEIVELANRLAAAGSIAGLTEANVFAFAETLASVGVEAEAGGTALSKVFTSVRDAVIDGGEKLNVFAKVAGESTSQFAAHFKGDAAGAITGFVEGLGRINQSGNSTTAVFEALELTDERLKRALLSTGEAGDYLSQQILLANKAWEDNNALSDEAAKRYETTAAQLEVLRNNVVDLAIEFGTAMLPAIRAIADLLGGLVDGFRAMPEPMRLMIAGGTILVGVVGALGGGFLMLLPRIIAVQAAYTTLAATAPTVAAGLRTVTIAAGGIGIALAAATAAYALFADSQDDASVSVDKMTAAFEAFARGEKAAAREMVLQGLAANELLGPMNDLGLTTAAVNEIMTTAQDGTTKNVAATKAWRAALDDAVASGKLTEIEASVLSQRIFELQNTYAGAAGDAADVADAQGRLGGATKDAAGDFTTAADAVDEYKKALDGVLGAAYGVDDATERLKTDIARLAADVTAAKEAGDGWATSLDESNTTGLANRQTLRDLAAGAADVAKAMVEAGEDPTAAMATLHASLLNTLEGLGFNRAQAAHLLDVLLRFPSAVSTVINVDTQRAEAAVTRLIGLIGIAKHSVDTLEAEKWVARSQAPTASADPFAALNLLPTITPSFGGGGSSKNPADEALRRRQEEDARQGRLAEFGGITVDEYKAYLNRRIAATEAFTEEWAGLMTELNRVNQEVGQGWQDAAAYIRGLEDAFWGILDRQHELGEISTDEYLAHLERRLKGLEKYSDEYMETWREINQLKDDISQDELDIIAAVEKQRLFDEAFYGLVSQRELSDLRSVSSPAVVVQGGSSKSSTWAPNITMVTPDPSRSGGSVLQQSRDDAYLRDL